MTFKSNILQLNTIAKQASDANKDKIQDIIDLYQNKKIPNSRTALNVAALLASKNRNVIKSGKPEREYYKVRRNTTRMSSTKQTRRKREQRYK